MYRALIRAPMVKAVFLIFSMAFANNVVSAEWKNLEILNHTGDTIKELYVSMSGASNWGDNLLNSNLENGSRCNINYDSEYTYYDMKIVFTSGRWIYWTDDSKMNLNDAWRITIYKNGDKYRWQKN